MAPWTSLTAGMTGPSLEAQGGPSFSTTPDSGIPFFMWQATGREALDQNDSPGSLHNPTVRTSSKPYYVGLKENLRISTSSGIPWQWRRICFTYKGFDFLGDNQDLNPSNSMYYRETSNGYQRFWNWPTNVQRAAIYAILFKGAEAADWEVSRGGIITAPLDRTRINVKYDKTRMIKSGNADGTMRSYKLWHPMRQTLVYDEDEEGDAQNTTAMSTTGKPGMGDYYVVDIFVPLLGATTLDAVKIDSTSTLYWHER
jgi:hypothetical protein